MTGLLYLIVIVMWAVVLVPIWLKSHDRAQVEKGLRETIPSGVLAGFPVVDVKVTLFDGSYHDVDSNENAFKMAASMALKSFIRIGISIFNDFSKTSYFCFKYST